MTPEDRARIARENGAKSKGPRTAAGKEQSRRNAIKHGARAAALKLLVPPHSAVLAHEERREFYKAFDTNVAKYKPADEHELAIVREITDLQWLCARNRTNSNALMNRELIRTAPSVTPLAPETFAVENTLAACDALANSATLRNLNREYAANTRLIVVLERRLAMVQRRWPATPAETQVSNEGSQDPQPQPVEKTTETAKRRVKHINVKAPLTDEKIRLYKAIYPNRQLEFNVLEPETGPKAA